VTDTESTPSTRDTGVSDRDADPSQRVPTPAGKDAATPPDTLFDRLDHWVERYIKDHPPEARPGL